MFEQTFCWLEEVVDGVYPKNIQKSIIPLPEVQTHVKNFYSKKQINEDLKYGIVRTMEFSSE